MILWSWFGLRQRKNTAICNKGCATNGQISNNGIDHIYVARVARSGIPEPYCFILRCRGEKPAIRRKGYCIDPTSMALELALLSACYSIPEPYCFIIRCRGEQPAIRRKGYCTDPTSMALEHTLLSACYSIPEPYCFIIRCRGEQPAIRRKG